MEGEGTHAIVHDDMIMIRVGIGIRYNDVEIMLTSLGQVRLYRNNKFNLKFEVFPSTRNKITHTHSCT